MTEPTEITYKRACQLALDAQYACNLSGVVGSFALATHALWTEARRIGKSTEWVNRHPVSVLFSNKLADLSASDPLDRYLMAYDVCADIAEGKEPTPAEFS